MTNTEDKNSVIVHNTQGFKSITIEVGTGKVVEAETIEGEIIHLNQHTDDIETMIEEIDGQNVAGGDIHAGLHNAINHVFFALEAEEFDEARKVVFSEVREIIRTIIAKDRERFIEILENNRGETLWGDNDSNEIMKESIDAYIIAVKDELTK